MSGVSQPSPLERLLNLLVTGLTTEMAEYLIAFRVDAEVQRRIAELAEKANEGELTDSDRREYEAYVKTGTFISTMQSMARNRICRGD